MDTAAFLAHVKRQPWYKDQVAHVQAMTPRAARYADLDAPLPSALSAALDKLGITRLYVHQARAINALRGNRNVVVCTPAASGKTLCYNLPVLETLLAEKGARALYLFPTKALAQDQLRAFEGLTTAAGVPVHAATYDGDTPSEERAVVRRGAQVLITNPDMLHAGILPNHRAWSRFLRRLRYVVVDEAHTYRGVFGSHVALTLRRLRRLCAFYGASPRFVLSSATIANPGEHAERLTGLPFQVVDEDGAPYGGKDFVFWNPPLVNEARGTRRSANSEASQLFTDLVKAGTRTILFARSRRLAELLYVYSRERLRETDKGLATRISPYRAGYTPEDRRRIEKALVQGDLLGVSATNALELGVDIGDLDATVLTGYPGSIASVWQQAGRSGRRGARSLSALVALDNPLDQYFMRHPDIFFGKTCEHALISPSNPHILQPHLLCAAYEFPLTELDIKYFGPEMSGHVAALVEQGLMHERRATWYLSATVAYPAERVNLRSTSNDPYTIVEEGTGALLETVESAVAFFQIHPGAVYLHQGETYLITELDIPGRTAHARATDAPYYTQAIDLTDIRIRKVLEERVVGASRAYLGEVEVVNRVLGYKRKRHVTEELVGAEPLDLPEQPFSTVALWWDIPEPLLNDVAHAGLDLSGGLHAAEHAAIGMLPLFALCDRNDIGGVSTPLHPDTGKPQVFIYDGHPGGVGIAEKGFELLEQLWSATLRAVAECPCEDGCPSCIQSPKCGNNNEPLDKQAAGVILRGVLGVTPGAGTAAPASG